MPLTAPQRQHLRRLAHHLKPIILIGQKGLTDAVIAEFELALAHHELVKVRLADDDRALRGESIERLHDATSAELVQIIGKTACFYRAKKKDPVIVLPDTAPVRAPRKARPTARPPVRATRGAAAFVPQVRKTRRDEAGLAPSRRSAAPAGDFEAPARGSRRGGGRSLTAPSFDAPRRAPRARTTASESDGSPRSLYTPARPRAADPRGRDATAPRSTSGRPPLRTGPRPAGSRPASPRPGLARGSRPARPGGSRSGPSRPRPPGRSRPR